MATTAAATATKAFLVTGANKGIGLAITKALLDRSASVFLGSRDLGRGEAAKASIKADQADRVTVVQLDVTDPASITKAVSAVQAKLGGEKLAGIINNAGKGGRNGSFGW